MKFRIIEKTSSLGKRTYIVQQRVLFWWDIVQVQKDFGVYGDAEYYSLETAIKLKNELETEANTTYSKKVIDA